MAEPSFSEENPAVYYAAVLLITLVAIWLLQKTLLSGGKALGIIRGDTLLILGGSSSGKTALYYKLATGKVPETLTSMRELDTELSIKASDGEDKAIKVVDFPGHPRLRGNLPKFLKRARSIVFVVDSTTVAKDVTPICQYLFTVMSTGSIAAQNLPVLIACNKNDKDSPGIPKIKSTLEKEMTQLIDTTGSLDDTGGGDDDTVALQKSGESFSFDSDAPCKVTFISCSATTSDCAEVVDFMRSAM